jgi:hypothetical protein
MTDPSYPSYTAQPPAGGPVGQDTGRRPGIVDAAFWLYIASAVVGLIVALVGLTRLSTLQQTASQIAAQQSGNQVPEGAIQGAIIAGVVIGLVINVLYLAAVIVFAVFFRRGANWARIVLTVLTALTIFSIIGLGAITFVLALIAIILSWLPASNAWFRQVKLSREPRTI